MRGGQIGFVFQTFELLPRQTALRNVELPLTYSGGRTAEVAPSRRSSASGWPIGWGTGPIRCRVDSGSGWRSLEPWFSAPALLLADEPTGNLDTQTGEGNPPPLRRPPSRGADHRHRDPRARSCRTLPSDYPDP